MLKKEDIAFEMVFEDEYLVVLNKKRKLLVQPTKGEKVTLTSLLCRRLKEKKEVAYPCHRLDRETTGLIIYAKSKQIQREIMRQFRRREIKKKYFAIVKGRMKRIKGIIKGYVLDREARIFGEPSKWAETKYRVIREMGEFSLVELEPVTGRTNQLRIQLAQLGNPVLGERKYALRREFKIDFKRLALHSYFLSFTHPVSKEKIVLQIPLPSEMEEFIKHYKRQVGCYPGV